MARTARSTSPAKREAAIARQRDLMARLDTFLAEHEGDEAIEDKAILAKIAIWAERYSERNAALIVMQDENATELRTFRGWQAEGRQVRKGEKGIYILAPAGQSGGADATEATETEPAQPGEAPRKFFRPMAVFDVRQTDEIKAQDEAEKSSELVPA